MTDIFLFSTIMAEIQFYNLSLYSTLLYLSIYLLVANNVRLLTQIKTVDSKYILLV